MSVPSNTLQTFAQSNIREDLINAVYNVDPFKTPLLNMARKGKAMQSFHEWDTDSLDAQNLGNNAVEGDDATATSLISPSRFGNYCQISQKVVQISGTSQAVVAAGGSNKMGYNLLKESKAIKRDMEGILTYNRARSAGTSSTARLMAGLTTWLVTNTVFLTNGTPAGAAPATADGTHTRTYNGGSTPVTSAVTIAMVQSALQKIFKSSGDCPEYALVSPANKQNISGFAATGTTRFSEVEDKTLNTSFDVYGSDFGPVKIVPDIFLAQSGDIYFVNPNYVKVIYLRPFQTTPLAKTGDSDKKQLLVEYTLEVGNEKAHGGIFDTTG